MKSPTKANLRRASSLWQSECPHRDIRRAWCDDCIALALDEAERRGRSSELTELARKCRRNIEFDMNVEFYQDVLRIIDDARIERAREARRRGKGK